MALDSLKKHLPAKQEESLEQQISRAAEWASSKFGGYSISHVNGRFKAGELATFGEAAAMQLSGGRYLVDETTAIVRFIFPCGVQSKGKPPFTADHFEKVGTENSVASKEVLEEASRIRWFFALLFVQTILEVVNGEAEIWMVESGMRHRLHIWKIESESESEKTDAESESESESDAQPELVL